MQGQAQVHVQASPERVYGILSDLTRMGEWSPECYRCEWLDGATGPASGARFKGYNRRGWLRWSTTCTVTDAEPGKAFAFETSLPMFRRRGAQTRWRYEIEPAEGGVVLTESFEWLWYFAVVVWLSFRGPRKRIAAREENMRQSLERIKAIAESETKTGR